jgi:hypothetical protein
MWKSQVQVLHDGRSRRVEIHREDRALSYAEVMVLWTSSEQFRGYFIDLLADTGLTAYFWETPPVSRHNSDRDFEFVQLDSPVLARITANAAAFSEHFDAAGNAGPVVRFANLGGDAELIAPRPHEGNPGYPHLAAFTRLAPRPRQHALWQQAGATMLECLDDQPTWLSTSGLGVYWLHLRLDATPKYYQYADYRRQHAD